MELSLKKNALRRCAQEDRPKGISNVEVLLFIIFDVSAKYLLPTKSAPGGCASCPNQNVESYGLNVILISCSCSTGWPLSVAGLYRHWVTASKAESRKITGPLTSLGLVTLPV